MTVLLLDLDGVLLHPAPGLDDALAAAVEWRDGGHAAFARELSRDPAYVAAQVGGHDVLAAMAPVLARHAPGADPATVHDLWCTPPVVDRDVADLLPDLRVDAVHLVTNQDTRRMTALAPVVAGLAVDGVFASCDLGERKPEATFFAAVLGVLGAAPAGCLLVDDSAANVEGARTAGMAALLHSSAAELRPELVRRGLLDG